MAELSREKTLHAIKLATEVHFREQGIEGLTVEVIVEQLYRQWGVAMRRTVAEEHMPVKQFPTRHQVTGPMQAWPKDWWQAFRQRWFPAWWLKRYPVLMSFYQFNEPVTFTHSIAFKVLYPDFSFPKELGPRHVIIPKEPRVEVQRPAPDCSLSGYSVGEDQLGHVRTPRGARSRGEGTHGADPK